MNHYLEIAAYGGARMLQRLQAQGVRCAIFNDAPAMLAAAVGNAELAAPRGRALSVEKVGVFKPHPAVRHQLAVDCLRGWPRPISAFSRRTVGMPVRPRLSASGCCGATGSGRRPTHSGAAGRRDHRSVAVARYPCCRRGVRIPSRRRLMGAQGVSRNDREDDMGLLTGLQRMFGALGRKHAPS